MGKTEQEQEKAKAKVELIEMFNKFIDESKEKRTNLTMLKTIGIKSNSYEFAAKIREFEKVYFPENEESLKEQELAEEYRLLFSMVDIGVDAKTAWILYNASQAFFQNVDLRISDTVKIKQKADEIWK